MLSRSTTFACLSSSTGCARAVAAAAAAAATTRSTTTRRTTKPACLYYYHSSSNSSQFRATGTEIPPQQPTPPEQWQGRRHHPPHPQSQSQSNSSSASPQGPTTSSLSSSSSSEAEKQQHQQPPPPPPPRESKPTMPPSKLPQPPTFTTPLTLTPNLTTLLPQLHSQTPHYVTAHIHARSYLLTAGDTLRLPFLMPGVEAGDVIRLNRAAVLGSRDFSLKGAPYVDERLFECRLRVVGTESEPLRVKEKTKRRQRHVKTVKSKHRYTILRVMEVKLKGLEELVEEGAQLAEEK